MGLLAREVRTSPAHLAAANNLKAPYTIYAGQQLVVPSTSVPMLQSPVQQTSIVVAQGDTLYSIGRKHVIAAAELARLNNLHPPHVIKPGQRLWIAPTASRTAAVTGYPAPAKAAPANSPFASSDTGGLTAQKDTAFVKPDRYYSSFDER